MCFGPRRLLEACLAVVVLARNNKSLEFRVVRSFVIMGTRNWKNSFIKFDFPILWLLLVDSILQRWKEKYRFNFFRFSLFVAIEHMKDGSLGLLILVSHNGMIRFISSHCGSSFCVNMHLSHPFRFNRSLASLATAGDVHWRGKIDGNMADFASSPGDVVKCCLSVRQLHIHVGASIQTLCPLSR